MPSREHMRRDKIRDTSCADGTGIDEHAQSVELLINLKLRSLMICCPRCGRRGLAMTKWVKGRNLKPLYVFHGREGRAVSECLLDKGDAQKVRGHIKLSKADMGRLIRRARPYVLFSGGLDSLCTLLYILKLPRTNSRKPTALHIDTTAGFPEVTKYVRKICRILEVPLTIVKPKRNYFELAERWGIPGFNARWCCKELKVKPARNFLSSVASPKIVVDGIRAAESAARNTYLPVWYHPAFGCLSVSPILGWSDQDVKSYVEASGLPEGPAKDLGCSAECWCGAYKKRTDFEKLLQVHPEIFDKLVQVEKAQQGRFTFIYENGRQVPLISLKRARGRCMSSR